MMKLAYVAFGGAIGSVLRYAASGLVHRFAGSTFPWGTLSVNLAGSFAIGFFWALFETAALTPGARIFIFAGILGGFTTFSTFTLESFNLLRDGELKLVAASLLLNNIAGLILVVLGYAAFKYILVLAK